MRWLIASTTLACTLLVSACSQYPAASEQDARDADSSFVAGEGSTQDVADPADGSQGVDAVWRLPDGVQPDPTAKSFAVEVSRVGCNSGVTGEVLAPTVEEVNQEVVVTFTVLPETTGAVDCQGNDWVPSTVRLSEALGERSLYDGECLPSATATAPGLCKLDGLRYPLARPR